MSGPMSGDTALGHQGRGSSALDCIGLNNHNFSNASLNGANEESIGMYAKIGC